MSKRYLFLASRICLLALVVTSVASAQISWVRHDIVKNLTNAYALQAADIDKDGKMDFLSASRAGAKWWRNNGNGSFSVNTIGSLTGAWSVFGADVDVQLTVYDVLGREVATRVKSELPAGHHQITWDGQDASGQRASSGMYFYQLRAGVFRASRRMLLVQ